MENAEEIYEGASKIAKVAKSIGGPVGIIGAVAVAAATGAFFVWKNIKNKKDEYHCPSHNSDENQNSTVIGTCAVCQQGYSEGTDTQAIRCGHVFHRQCLNQLMRSGGYWPRCPSCQGSIF